MRFFKTRSCNQLDVAAKQPPVMVLGMHRSGTSFITGTLQAAGLELGKYSAWNPHNLKGNRENPDIVALHDRILARHQATWDAPPAQSVRWSWAERRAAQALIEAYPAGVRWGFKDPRALLLVEGWLKLLPTLSFIGIFRHPLAVCASLSARGGMPKDKALALWEAYNKRLLVLHQEMAFPLLCFDDEEELLHQKLQPILVNLHLTPLKNTRFFSAELKHYYFDAATVPAAQSALYYHLRQRAC